MILEDLRASHRHVYCHRHSDRDKAGVELKAYSAVKSPEAKRKFSAAKICILFVPGLSETYLMLSE